MSTGWSSPRTGHRTSKLDRARAEQIGLAALLFVTADPERLSRFLATTGIEPASLMASAGDAATLAALLEHVAGDDSTLLVFAATAECSPEDVIKAQALLGLDPTYDRSI